MKKLKQLSVIILLFHLFSCNNFSSASVNQAQAATASAAAATGGDARFSCMLDGKPFSESGSNGNINAAFGLKDDDKKGHIFFMLADVNDPSQKLSFELPGKTGTTTIQNLPPHFSFEGLVLKGLVTYIDDPVTVNVTSITPSRIAGTFS